MTATVFAVLGIAVGACGAYLNHVYPSLTGPEQTYADRRGKWGARSAITLLFVGLGLVLIAFYIAMERLDTGDQRASVSVTVYQLRDE